MLLCRIGLFNKVNSSNKVICGGWSIVRLAPGHSNVSERCLLCLHEELLILNYHNPAELLNKKSELMAKCCHENKFLISNYKGNN